MNIKLEEDEAIIKFFQFSQNCKSRDCTVINGCRKYADGCNEKCCYWQTLKIVTSCILNESERSKKFIDKRTWYDKRLSSKSI